LISDQGDAAIVIDTHPDTPGHYFISAYMDFDSRSASAQDISYSYLTACDTSSTGTDFTSFTYMSLNSDNSPSLHASSAFPNNSLSTLTDLRTYSLDTDDTHTSSPHRSLLIPVDSTNSDQVSVLAAKKKYKPVALKTRPILADLPDKFRIIRNIIGDPLADMPTLSPNPPPFNPTGRYTTENRDRIDKVHSGDFLWPAERNLMHHFMCLQNQGFAWNDTERGRFREDFFPPVLMPVVEHKPWVLRNMPIPPGLYDEICNII